MPNLKPAIRSRKGHPTRLDDLVQREDVPGTGKKSKEFEELVHSNYRYLHTRGETPPKLDLQPVIGNKEVSAWRIPLGANISEGLPGLAAEQTTPADLKVKLGDERSQESFRPDWATLSYQPRPATSRAVRFLRRRNGRRVVPDFVIGNDDRQNFYPNTWPWFCIGRIDVSVFGTYIMSGTGALVGKNIVLTASHMVPWGAGPGNWSMKFTPGYYDGKSTQGSGVYSYTEKVKGYPDYDQGDDMAVLKLYHSLGSSLGYFGYKTYSDDWEGEPYWTLVGYPTAVGGLERPTRQSNIVITDDDSEGDAAELEHTGDSSAGNSGGPLWAWWDDSPRVIGTHSGSEWNWDEDNNVAAGGPALSKLIKWARDNW